MNREGVFYYYMMRFLNGPIEAEGKAKAKLAFG